MCDGRLAARNARFIAILAVLLSGLCPSHVNAAATAPPAPNPVKAQVMIVGIAHLVARNDVHNSQFTDSPLTPKRQAEIAEVLERLGKFHPTKVLIEATAGDSTFAERYAAYLKGSYTLPADETYQFGFKLAAGAGNATVYPIDTWGPTIIDDA